ncbi:MAG: tetratricopeptide repeat protein [Gammaproteobacteria bacterium]|nr:tetratricopeptide repeat protein [Gammaproteobacteria bacterium]
MVNRLYKAKQKRINKRLFFFFTLILLTGCQTLSVNNDNLGSDNLENEDLENEKILRSYAMGIQAYNQKDWPKAKKIFTHVTKTDPSNSEAWFKLANIYARENKPKEAILYYQEAAIRAPKNPKIWHNLAIIQLRQATLSFLRVVENIDSSDPLSIRANKIINLYDKVQNIIDLNNVNAKENTVKDLQQKQTGDSN